jgi:hypothetical protein
MSAQAGRPWQGGTAANIDAQEDADIAASLRDYQARWLQQRLGTCWPIGQLLAEIVFAEAHDPHRARAFADASPVIDGNDRVAGTNG